jgi:ABC-type lipoprotein export system ATPase subunit
MTQLNHFAKGSEWRKWDLHVHTPESVLNNQFGSDWDLYVTKLFKKAIANNIHAIGITDYFTIEGYKKLKIQYLQKDDKLKQLFSPEEISLIKKIKIFPNIEFRITNMTNGNKINFHVIFSDQVSVSDIETHFLHNLDFVFSGEPQNPDFKERLKIETLVDLGRKLKEEHKHFQGSGTDLFVGMMNASVSDSDISTELTRTDRFKEKYLIGVPSDEDLSSVSWNGQGHQFRKILIQKADFLMTSNEKTRNWALGKYEGTNKQIKEFKGLKPCLWGSDAHDYNKLFIPDNSKYTWIKGDVSFEGLRQTLYEPEARVFIGLIPASLDRVNSNKTKYVKSLTLEKVDSAFEEDWFDGTKIEFNSELVAIIGNKGKGKSAVADILGILGNSHNHEHFSFLSKEKFKNKKDKKANKFKGTIEWESGDSKEENLDYIPDLTSYERIKYIPQNFLEVLCNDENKELESEIKKVIYSHVPEEDRSNKSDLNELISFKASSINTSIQKIVTEIKQVNEEIINLENKNKDDYLNQIKAKLEVKKNELERHLEIKPAVISKPTNVATNSLRLKDLTDFKKIIDINVLKTKNIKKEEVILKTKLDNALSDIESFSDDYGALITKLKAELSSLEVNAEEIVNLSINTELIKNKISEKHAVISILESKIDKNNINSFVKLSESIEKEIREISSSLDKTNKEYQEYTKKIFEWEKKKLEIKGEGNFSENKDSISYYESLITYVGNNLESDLIEKYSERKSLIKRIFNEKKKLIKIYEELYQPIERFVSDYHLEDSDYKIQFFASLEPFNFVKSFFSYIDKGKKGSFCGAVEGGKRIDDMYGEVDFNDESQVITFLDDIIHALNNDLRDNCNSEKRDPHSQIKKDKLEKFYEFIFSLEYLEPKYDLKLGNTVLSKLSPGEKGALLLIFYLLIDKEDVPLILDQPEENLDNQTVFEIVVRFIKQAKQRRQIIIITHNPNLAVVCDAEQIIHANIDKKEKFKVSYFSGSIENPDINRKIVEILEGTLPAFNTRNLKYSITKRLKLED